jgi:hypothetical protein
VNRYLSGLLDSRRFEEAVASPVIPPTDVRELVLGVANLICQGSASNRLILNIPRVVSVVPTDGVLLEHALANLIENALSYSPVDASVDLTIDAGSPEPVPIQRLRGMPRSVAYGSGGAQAVAAQRFVALPTGRVQHYGGSPPYSEPQPIAARGSVSLSGIGGCGSFVS